MKEDIVNIPLGARVIDCNSTMSQGNIRVTEEGNWKDRKWVREGNLKYEGVAVIWNAKVYSWK